MQDKHQKIKMEACPKVPMLSFDLKVCNYEKPVFSEKIFNYIYSHYQENPEGFRKEINELNALREVLFEDLL